MGDHSFLNTVMMAKMRPPTTPTSASGATVAGEGEFKKRCHVQAAVAMAQISSKPVLLTVPCSVMASPKATPWLRNACSFSAGLAVLKIPEFDLLTIATFDLLF